MVCIWVRLWEGEKAGNTQSPMLWDYSWSSSLFSVISPCAVCDLLYLLVVVSGGAQQDRLQLCFLNAARHVCLQRCAQVGWEPWASLEIRLGRRHVDAGNGEHRLEEIKKETPEGALGTWGLWDEYGWVVEIVRLVVQMNTRLKDRELNAKKRRLGEVKK